MKFQLFSEFFSLYLWQPHEKLKIAKMNATGVGKAVSYRVTRCIASEIGQKVPENAKCYERHTGSVGK